MNFNNSSTSLENLLLEIGKAVTYFRTPDMVAYADIWIDEKLKPCAVGSRLFKSWLTDKYYQSTGKVLKSAPLNSTIRYLEARALFDPSVETRPVRQSGEDLN